MDIKYRERLEKLTKEANNLADYYIQCRIDSQDDDRRIYRKLADKLEKVCFILDEAEQLYN